jgi:hypothetical protein
VEEQDEHPEEDGAPVSSEPPERNDPYFPFPTLETSLWAFLDLHFGQTAFGFSLRLNVTTSNCFLHLSHSNS